MAKESFIEKVIYALFALVIAYIMITEVLCKGEWLCILTTGGALFAIFVVAVKKYLGVK